MICNNPLATTRIQLLRVIINFCDRDSNNLANKEFLVSDEEREILFKYLFQIPLFKKFSEILRGGLKAHHFNYEEIDMKSIKEGNSRILNSLLVQMTMEPNNPEERFFTRDRLINNAFENVKEKGLMNKVISLLKKYHPNSNYRFWLASCVESFLRGFHSVHQIFVAHTGLLYNLIEQILKKRISKVNNIQISYDLIGEIIKFNKYNIILLENLCTEYNWLEALMDHAGTNVVDSNVFLRALILSFEKFNNIHNKEVTSQKFPLTFSKISSSKNML